MLTSTPNFNLTVYGESNSNYFDRRIVLADAQRKLLITNFATYDGESPQLVDFGLIKVDLTKGNMSYLNFNSDRPVFSFSSISKAVMSTEGIYYFALSREITGYNFIFSYDLESGDSKYISIPDGNDITGLAFIDNTLYVSNGIAMEAYTPELTMKRSKPTGFNYGGSNLIATQENGKNVLYYAAANVVFRLDTITNIITKFELDISNTLIHSISSLGNGHLMVIATVAEKDVDVIYSVNVFKGFSLRLFPRESFINTISSCSN